ncbi:hypothetical protein C8R45DRAFT_974038 [Mycena sanguinolenta]|nr:hypothetical protein C8R45DRAFT_974038 [Mycena sanguinolenta]
MADPDPYYFAGRTTPTPGRHTADAGPLVDEEVLELTFVCRRKTRGSILNSTVVGRDGYTPYYHIVTGAERRTVFRTNNGRTVATIDWMGEDGAAFVAVPNSAVERQRVSRWLAVANDASYRMMTTHGERYMWVPQNDCICMYHWNPASAGNIPHLLARIDKEGKTVTLEITAEAVNRGLLDMAVVATTVFQSGWTID